MEKTLDELKAENAALEAAKAQAPQAGAEDEQSDAVEVEELNDQDAEPDEDGENTEAEAESWMNGDSQESQSAERKFTDSDVAAAKKKMRAKLEREHQSEVERLQAELEAERQKHVLQPAQVGQRPTREQFFDKDDPDEAYAEALVDWKLKAQAAQQSAQQQQYEQQRQALEQRRQIETSVDQHYERAAQLAEKSGITPEAYQSADLRVRSAIDQVFPGGGDNITDALISNLGEGSEKVFYNLGVNRARLAELESLLKQDRTGLKAAVWLGKLASELNAPAKRTSNAPAPAAQIRGDRNTTEAGRALLKRYKEASAAGNAQKAFDLKRQAKQQGVNTQSW